MKFFLFCFSFYFSFEKKHWLFGVSIGEVYYFEFSVEIRDEDMLSCDFNSAK